MKIGILFGLELKHVSCLSRCVHPCTKMTEIEGADKVLLLFRPPRGLPLIPVVKGAKDEQQHGRNDQQHGRYDQGLCHHL